MQEDDNPVEVAANYAATITAEVEGAEQPDVAAADYVFDALDAEYVVTSRGDVNAVHLIVATGGPHVEVHHHVGADWVTVVARWWSPAVGRDVHAPALAAELDGLAEAWQDAYVMTGRGSAGVHR